MKIGLSMPRNNLTMIMKFRMDLTIALIKEVSEKTGTNEEEIWNQVADYIRYQITTKNDKTSII